MKNQYNFSKTIDKSTTSSVNSQEEKNTSSSNNRLQVKSSLSKLHNLVTSKFTTTSNNNNNSPLSSSTSTPLKQKNTLNTQNNSIHEKSLQRSGGRIFSLPTQTSGNSENIAQHNKLAEIKDTQASTVLQDTKKQRVNQMQSNVKQRNIGNAILASKSTTNNALNQKATNSSSSSSSNKQQTNISEKIAPELAKCYDEIDQIYDYIRGLAPLPLQLRKIKSIDFEQIERDKRIQQQLSSLPTSKQQPQTLKNDVLSSRQPPNVDNLSTNRANVVKLKTKARQRDASDEEPLKEPNANSSPIFSKEHNFLPSLKPNQANSNLLSQSNKQRIQGPLPIKVTTTTDNVRPNVKRVESLNLGASLNGNANATAAPCLTQPAYLISSAQRGQLFRLPRAHSTSTLNKPGAKQTQANGDSLKNKAVMIKCKAEPQPGRTIETRTLPAIRTSRTASPDTKLVSASLGRQLKTNHLREHPQLEGSKKAADGKVLDLVESFVDDDDVSSVDSKPAESSKERSQILSKMSVSDGEEDNNLQETSQENLTSASDSSSATTTSSTSSSSESTTSSSSDQSSSSDNEFENRQDQQRDDLKGQHNVERRLIAADMEQKFGNEEARNNEKWTEKSHSDYENDTVSGITTNSSSASNLLSSAANERVRRRSSSGTGSRENHGSHSSSSAASDEKKKKKLLKMRTMMNSHNQEQQQQEKKRISDGTKNQADQVEHIYEQIPAHKNIVKQKADTKMPQSLPHSHLLDRSYNHFKQNRQQQRMGPGARPFNYPVAFAPNIAPLSQKQLVVSSANFIASPRVAYQQQQHSSTGGTYPMPLHAMRANPTMHPFNSNSQPRPLDHRHRLSMNNLHLLSYLNHPFVGAVYHPTEQVNNKLVMSRSSSSGKLNRIRAPRLSPAQLIAQIQMPRAFSKTRPVEHHHMSGGGQATSERAAVERILKGANNPKQQAIFMWQPASQTAINQVHQMQYHRGQPMDQFYRPGYSIDMENKRRNSRRLTAIGIEESFDSAKHPNLRHHLQQQQQQQQQVSSRPLESSSGGVRAVMSKNSATSLKQSSMSHFEPPQLMTAPLIDDDEDEDNDEDEDEDENENSSTTGSDEQIASSPVGKVSPAAAVMSNSGNNEKKLAANNSGRSKKLLAHQQAAAFIQNRCLNSISDLHSFSSTSGTSEDNDDANEVEDDDADNSEEEEDDESNLANDRIGRALDNNDEANFVSSRSFIKCYYGRESNRSPRDSKLVESNRLMAKENNRSFDKDERRTINEKLTTPLSNRVENINVSKGNRPGPESSQQRPNIVTSPIAAMFVAAQQQQQHKSNAAPLVGEFLNAEGPILVRDRRIAALRSDWVRHYQYPTVKVAKVPNYSAQKADHHEQKIQSYVFEPKEQQAVSSGAKRSFLPDQQAGSTNTTNSTSSYEAAIKNSREDKSIEGQEVVKGIITNSDSSATNSQQPQKKKPAPSTGQSKHQSKNQVNSGSNNCVGGLIKVPKLNKQSHLLNRPLPKPPVISTTKRNSSSSNAFLNSSVSGQNQGNPSSSSSSAAAKPYLVHSPKQQTMMSSSKHKMLFSAKLDLQPSATSPVGASKAHARSQYLQDLEYRASRHSSLKNSNSLNKAALNQENQDFKCRPTTKNNKLMGSNSLSPLNLSFTTHPSPTVTTCTSSGISSRLTAATHQASGSNDSSQRSSSNNQQSSARVKSFSELHKQSKQQQQQRQQMLRNEKEATAISLSNRGLAKRADSFALMDDDDEEERGDDQDFDGSEDVDCEDINLAADRLDVLSSPEVALEHQSNKNSSKQQLANGCDISATKDSNMKQVVGQAGKRKEEAAMSSNLRLFDERFSSKFVDQQLASSNDSLLESINFSGTLNRKSLEKVSAAATATTTTAAAQPT